MHITRLPRGSPRNLPFDKATLLCHESSRHPASSCSFPFPPPSRLYEPYRTASSYHMAISKSNICR
ncbi:hypothetical protein BDZ89DRAFT_1070756 [Hymenopellis radicata]|nr:hypothetical protein BDZ89DRAFT_1070756 [Hymenopellis radicata]